MKLINKLQINQLYPIIMALLIYAVRRTHDRADLYEVPRASGRVERCRPGAQKWKLPM